MATRARGGKARSDKVQGEGARGKVLLSLDVEEFDLPREHGGKISLERGVNVSAVGLSRVLELFARERVKATFFTTGNFAEKKPELVQQMLEDGHEVGCHGVDHFRPMEGDATRGKKIVERAASSKVMGYRQPRMFEISYPELKKAGYLYDSSVNPAWIPGRYNNLKVSRRPVMHEGVWEVPTSVVGLVPLFWLALHLFPVWAYILLGRMAIRKNGYMATYFHPWEFGEIRGFSEVPFYIKANSGEKLVRRLEKVIRALKKRGYEFVTYEEYVKEIAASK